MLDLKIIRQDPQGIADRLRIKGHHFDAEAFATLDSARKSADIDSQSLLAERKRASKLIGERVAQGVSVDDAKAEVAGLLADIEGQITAATDRARIAQAHIDQLLQETPNIPSERVPEGASEAENIEISRWGVPHEFDFPIQDHVDIGEQLSLLDMEVAGKITGSRFSVLKGDLARLQRALIQFMLDTHTQQHGYTEVYVPFLVNTDSLVGTGQLPKFSEDLFKVEGTSEFYMIPTAEVPVTNMVRDRIIEEAELGEEGLSFVAHTPCFRSEAGSYGRDTRGLIRQHQFEKVELVKVVRAAQAEAALETLTGHAEAILQALELPYRKVLLCGGDLGFSAAMTYDLEVWLPAQNTYREISSCSHFGDYQARRMQARWRNPSSGKPELLHTLNGSGLAVGRTLVALLENYQQRDGQVSIPKVLQPYMGGSTHIG